MRARAAEWDAAIVLRFRALARGCLERGVVDPPPGATVHAFARAAARAFPALAPPARRRRRRRSTTSATCGAPARAELYRLVAAVDDAVVVGATGCVRSVPA